MIFNNQQPIYIQIIEQIYLRILTKEWIPDQRIPSVRDMAIQFEVNPNTVMRSFERLQQNDIIYNKRGMGYFLATNALEQVKCEQKEEFFKNELPKIFEKISSLEISPEDINSRYIEWTKNK